MFSISPKSLTFKIYLFFAASMVGAVLAASFWFWDNQKHFFMSSLEKTGTALCENLAWNSRYTLWTEDKEEIENYVQGLLSLPHVALIGIERTQEKGFLLWKRNLDILKDSESQKLRLECEKDPDSALCLRHPGLIHFRKPVQTLKFAKPATEMDLFFDHRSSSWVTLGTVHVFLSSRDMKDTLESLRSDILKTASLLLFLTSLLAFPFIRTITTPLKQLVKTTQEIAEGRMVAPPAESRRDEIGALSASFRVMSEKLNLKQKQIEQVNLSLQQANTDLQRKNMELETTISEKLQTLKEKDSLREQVAHMEKIASVGKLASGLAHEFNNILGVVRAEAEGSLDVGTMDFYRDSMRGILKAAHAGSLITANLLNYAKPAAPRKQPVLIRRVVENALLLMKQNFVHYQIRVTESYGDQREVWVDVYQMQQVFLNLLTNARDAMRNGGEMWVQTLEKAESLSILFKDSGSGIPESLLEKVFEPFFTTKNEASEPHLSGTGLGLSVSSDILHHHGGSLSLQNHPEGGTLAQVSLPFSDGLKTT